MKLKSHSILLLTQIALTCLLSVTLVGCNSKSEQSDAVSPPPLTSQASDEKDPPGGIELPPGDISPANIDADTSSSGIEMPGTAGTTVKVLFGTWEEINARASSSKRVTVVDVWSLVCEPCVKEFPGLVELHKTLGDRVTCISVDIDYDGRKSKPPESYEAQVTSFLTQKGANFTNYISSTPSDDFYTIADLDSIPAVLIYDADGVLVKKFVDTGENTGFGYENDIVPFVKSLLK